MTDNTGANLDNPSPFTLQCAIVEMIQDLVDLDGVGAEFEQVREAVRMHLVQDAVEADAAMGEDRRMCLFAREVDDVLNHLRVAPFTERDIEYLRDGAFKNLPAIVTGQVMMQALGENSIRDANGAKFWVDVLHELGPDWITELKRVARWMDLTDKIGWDQLKDAIVEK